jgi:hypothetical protein
VDFQKKMNCGSFQAMKTRIFWVALGFSSLCLAGLATAQTGYQGSGIANENFGGQAQASNRAMFQLADQINETPKPAEPWFTTPEWMKPKPPQMPKPKFLSPSNGPSNWPKLQRPKWLGGKPKDPVDVWNQNNNQKSPGMFSAAGKSFNQWRQKTGENIRATNESIRESNSNAWQNFSKGFQRPGWMSPGANAKPPAVQPPLRSAENWKNQPTQRF